MITTDASTDEILSYEEMERRFDGEHVLVGDPELDPTLKVIRGRVLCHSRNRDDLDAVDLQLRPRSAAYLYFGPWPDDGAYLL
jgi:hypothetical protein